MAGKAAPEKIAEWNRSMEQEVCAYEQEQMPTGQIVLYGASYFTRWGPAYGMIPVREVLTGASGAPCVINRGFGSSCPEHHLQYYSRLIRPLAPNVLVYASYGNNAAYGYTDEAAWKLAQQVIALARADFPDIRIYLCGANRHRSPTPEALEQALAYDSVLQRYADTHESTGFIGFLDYAPLQNPENFIEDGVHMNQIGYDRYAERFRAALQDVLAQY